LIESHAISYAPSLTVLREMMKIKRKPKEVAATSPTLLAFGNPDVGQSTKNRVEAVLMDEQLLPLPEAEKQVRILGQLYGAAHSKIYIGADAREERFKKEAAACRILQLATHGMADDGSPMYSHLVLSQGQTDENEDGLLEAWETHEARPERRSGRPVGVRQRGDRVVSGEGGDRSRMAFFVAGCPTTVVSHGKSSHQAPPN
jgi:CHAT domain-containing protein